MAYRRAVVRDRIFLADIGLTFPDGTKRSLGRRELMADGLKIKSATSGSDSFDIGCAAVGECDIRIHNTDGQYNTFDFEGAVLDVKVGLQLADGVTEWIPKGIYTADSGKFTGAVISITAYDNMTKFDRPYTVSKLSYPTTLGAIVADACSICGVALASSDFPNRNLTVKERPTDEALTFRQVLSWAGQIACRYWQCDAYGRLVPGWYDTNAFADCDGMDGGIFDSGTPVYQTGDSADGGNFHPWDDSGVIDGGDFEELQEYHHIHALSSISVATDDVVITGVRVTEAQDSTVQEEPASYLEGTDGYILEVGGNDLIQKGSCRGIAEYLGSCLIGLRFRPVSVSCQSDPAIEAGDPAIVTDYSQNSYKCYVTDTTYQLGGYQAVACNAKTPARNSTSRFTEATQAFVKAKKNTKVQINEYDKAVQTLTSLITQSFGVYKTEEKLEDGSTVFYMHNKPTLKESDTIWKMAADAFAVSTDGGKTWNAGMDSKGNAVVNVLSAIGIRCDWIRAGTLTLGGEKNVNGVLRILDASGKEIGVWDRNGVRASNVDLEGTFSNVNEKGRGVKVEKVGLHSYSNNEEIGSIAILPVVDSNGNNIGKDYMEFKLKGENSSYEFYIGESGKPVLQFNNTGMAIPKIQWSKTGRAEFSDGTYLTFNNGILTGGNAKGGAF